MTACAPTAAAPKSRLALVALIVLALHALLLFGLPHWARTVPATGGPPVFQFRTIALEAPQPAATDVPAETKPQPLQPKPKPKPKPRPKPQSAPSNPPVTPAAQPQAASADAAGTASLLQGPPRAAFGGKMPLPPIVAPLPPDQVAAVMQQAAQPASSAAPDAPAPGAPGPIPPVQLPRSASITYQATVTPQTGRPVTLLSTIVWQHDEQYYNLRWTLYGPAIGDRSRYAAGLITARGLAPVTAQAMGADGYSLIFDYAQSRLRGPSPLPASASEPADTPPPLPPGAQDPFSLWFQLAASIAGDPAQYPVGSRIVLPVASDSGQNPRSTDFIVADDSDFSLPGQFANQRSPALHLVHEPASGQEQDARIELWLGKRLDYLPIRLLIIPPAGGDRLEMTLQNAYAEITPPSLSFAPSPAASGAGGD